MGKYNGYVFYRGPSMLDGSPIVAIATGTQRASQNGKTGPMVQTWILPAEEAPVAAAQSGKDAAVCGACPHRWALGGDCYVTLFHAPARVWKAWKEGVYGTLTDLQLEGSKHVELRMGAYGDPAAVPPTAWTLLLLAVTWQGRTAYTHQWREYAWLRPWAMASVDSPAERLEAKGLGWRTFRVAYDPKDRQRGEAICPATQKGSSIQCATCPIKCDGTNGNSQLDVWVLAHGKKSQKILRMVRGEA